MSNAEQLALLKSDLGFYGDQPKELVSYLDTLLQVARYSIRREGVHLSASLEDNALVASYAAWLYRKRAADGVQPMPRMIRWQINLRLTGKTMGGGDHDI